MTFHTTYIHFSQFFNTRIPTKYTSRKVGANCERSLPQNINNLSIFDDAKKKRKTLLYHRYDLLDAHYLTFTMRNEKID